MKVDLLAIAAHPDDVELTSGGTLLKMKSAGYSTGILDLTRGETGTRGTPETRIEEARRAGEILGLKVRKNLGLPDARLQVSDEFKVSVAEVIRELEPHTVILPYWEGRHPDHYTAAMLGYEGCFIAGIEKLCHAGRGVPAIQDFVRRGICRSCADVCRGHHAILRAAQGGHSGVCIAIQSAEGPQAGKGGDSPGCAGRTHEPAGARLWRVDRSASYAEGYVVKETMQVEDVVKMPVRSF